VCVCVCVRARARVRACVRACVRVITGVSVCVRFLFRLFDCADWDGVASWSTTARTLSSPFSSFISSWFPVTSSEISRPPPFLSPLPPSPPSSLSSNLSPSLSFPSVMSALSTSQNNTAREDVRKHFIQHVRKE
jgi:hypothetical protein